MKLVLAALIAVAFATGCTPAAAAPAAEKAAADTSFTDFASHMVVVGDIESYSTPVIDALNLYDFDGALDAVRTFDAFLAGEQDWLAAHPPLACYGAMHRTWSEVYVLYRDGLSLMADWLYTTDINDPSPISAATAKIALAASKIEAMNDNGTIEDATEACAA